MPILDTFRNLFYGTPDRCGLAEAIMAGKPNLWKLRALQYSIIDRPTNLAASVVDDTIKLALSQWSAIDPPGFTFVRTDQEGLANLVFRAFDPPAFGYDYAGRIIENSQMPYLPEFVNQLVVSVRKTANWQVGILIGPWNLLGAYGHGIGHALGLGHDSERGNLMSDAVGHATKPTARDIQRFQELHAVTPGPPAPSPDTVFARHTHGNKHYEGTLKAIN